MAKMLDFNKIDRPSWHIKMKDEQKTLFKITTPTEGMVEDLQALAPELTRIQDEHDEAADAAYGLAARLISCNLDDIEVTPDELRHKYWPEDRLENLRYMAIFFRGYMGFLAEIAERKN